MSRKILGILVMTLLIATAVLPATGIVKEYNEVEKESAVVEFESIDLDNLEIAADPSDYIASDNLDVVIDASNSGEITCMNDAYHIYEGLNWKLYVTAYWDPPQGRTICLWVDPATLPAGATFDPCHCAIDVVTSTLEWTPSIGQAGTYYITFYVGESCYEPIGYFTVVVVVHPYEPEPQETFEIYECHDWHLTVTAYWVPPQPSRLICLWVDTSTLPTGATFTDCHCDYGEVSSDLYWHPQIGQAGEYIITFLCGDICGYYWFFFSIKVIVLPGCEDQDIEIYQVDYTLDDTTVVDSAFGSVDVTYTGTPYIQYYNLAVNGEWVIQNIPLLSCEGIDIEQTETTGFDLGVSDGTDVTEVEAAYSIDVEPSDYMPSPPKTVEVVTRIVEMYQGKSGTLGLGQAKNEAGMQVVGYSLVDWAAHNSPMPNQDCAHGECVPAAVSNSLQWLRSKYGKPPAGKNIDIATMKTATKWNGGCASGWGDSKRKYMNDNGYEIDTTLFPDPENWDHEATAAECKKALQEIKRGQDVELDGEFHCAVIVGMSEFGDGRFCISVSHDTRQGHNAGTDGPNDDGGIKKETVIYDPNAPNPRAQGGWCLDGKKINGFVVECPKIPTWDFHFWYYDCPGGWLEIYGTHNCERLYPPIFDDYIISCEDYTGYIPDTIDGYSVNDIIFDFYWDYWCNNEDHIKFVNSDWNPYTEQWELNPIGDALDEYVIDDLTVPLIGDPYGEIQDVYVVMDISEFAADPRPPQDEYYISSGECDDLPGYLIGTTPITFNPDASPDENPFSTNSLTGVLYHDGEVTCSPKAEPPVAPTIDGATNGKAGKEYDYTFVTTDPNEDEVYYYIEWGDGNIEEWIGPYDSGEEATLSHSWDEKGTYITKVKAKDTDDLQSDWTTLEVSMPKNKPYINIFSLRFFGNHPHLFPLLQKLFGLQ